MYPILAFIFLATLIFSLIIFVGFIFRPQLWKPAFKFYAAWLLIYGVFILFGTGTNEQRTHMPHTSSPYKLPWQAKVSRFVSQGNVSFTSHRDLHRHA